jgi:hypothetical protein
MSRRFRNGPANAAIGTHSSGIKAASRRPLRDDVADRERIIFDRLSNFIAPRRALY